MTLGMLFWILMILWLLLSLYWGYSTDRAGGLRVFAPVGINLMVFVLLFLLGVRTFGWPIQS